MVSHSQSEGLAPGSVSTDVSSSTKKNTTKHTADSDQVSLLTATTSDFLPPLGHWTTLGGLVILGGFGLAVAYTAIAPYTVVVKAPAVVRPAGELRIVQAATEGAIAQIKVRENQVVKRGDVLATISDSQLTIRESQLQGTIQQNQLQLRQITAALKALETKIAAETLAIQRMVSAAEATLRRSEREYRDQQITTQTQVQEAEANLSLAREELNRYKELSSTGAVTQLQIKEKEAAYQAAQARLQRTQAGLNPSHANVDMAQERIAQAGAQGESTLASLTKEKEELIRRHLELQNQVNTDQKELQQVAISQQKTVIRAPETGTILKLELRNTGQVVKPGEAIAHIAPSQTPVVIKARVPAQDIANVQTCQASEISRCTTGKAFLRISAYPYPDYGVLVGAVRAIPPDATTAGAAVGVVTQPYYEVTIQPETAYLKRNGQQYFLKPGMEVSAEIVSRQETVLSFILRKARLLSNF